MLRNDLKVALAMMAIAPLAIYGDSEVEPVVAPEPTAVEQGYTPGEKVRAGRLPGAYSENAGYICDGGWDVYVTGNYIWWDWVQDEGMSAGFTGLTGFSSLALDTAPSVITPGYASGFQAGLGFSMKGMDDWNFYGEYTRYKNSASKSFDVLGSASAPAVTSDFTGSVDISLAYNNADFLLQRHFYFGKKLTSNFYTGLRALWINSTTDSILSGSGSAVGVRAIGVTDLLKSIHNNVSSWALGPKFGLDSNWLLGYGLKMMGNISASVLYTRYTGSYEDTTTGTGTFVGTNFSLNSDINIQTSNYATIRPVFDTFLGLGWGSYFCKEGFHLDLAVGYDFNVHWNYVTAVEVAGSKNSSNLYLHGLNVQARFDF